MNYTRAWRAVRGKPEKFEGPGLSRDGLIKRAEDNRNFIIICPNGAISILSKPSDPLYYNEVWEPVE